MMECVREEPRQRRRARHRNRDAVENGSQSDLLVPEDQRSDPEVRETNDEETNDDVRTEHNDIIKGDAGSTQNTSVLNDSEKEKLNCLNTRLSEQGAVFKTEKSCVHSKKLATKERISEIFSEFRELMNRKERELLEEVDLEFTIAGRFLEDFVGNIDDDKQKISELLSTEKTSGDSVDTAEIEQIEEDIDTSLNIRNDILDQFRVPYFVVSEQSLETVKGLKFGEFQEFPSASETYHIEEEGAGSGEIDSGATENEPDNGSDENTNGAESRSETGRNADTISAYVGENAVGGGETVENCNEKEREALGATVSSEEDVTPTAPPILPEESPPPYWQAMGLQGPQEQMQPRNDIPGYYDIPHSPRLPENTPELWHSFPIRRQYDRRGPTPVALTWDHGRICIADKANMRVKFFFPNGQLITEMFFSGTEIHDVSFLEEAQGESRYVLSSPKSRTLMIIGIDSQNAPKVIRKLTFSKQFSSVCRGPRGQTLLGVDMGLRSGNPVVNMFSFSGNTLLTLTHTPSFAFFQYIKSVETSGNYIIILDWKLNSLSVFQDDGAAVGEYKGTANSPLIHPLDMALDNQGNILILNGEFSNIHVTDLHCNPVEIIQLPRHVVSSTSGAKLLAFDLITRRLAIARSNGEIAVFTFQNSYDALPQRNLAPNIVSPNDSSSGRRVPEVLPLVEGMLPSTIEDIITRQPVRNRARQFHL